MSLKDREKEGVQVGEVVERSWKRDRSRSLLLLRLRVPQKRYCTTAEVVSSPAWTIQLYDPRLSHLKAAHAQG